MGLNWAEGLKAAGEGVQQMAGIKMQEADYLYKQVAQQNRQRFETKQQEDQQEFLSGMQEERLEVTREGQAASEAAAQRRHEEAMARLEQSTEQFRLTFEQGQQRLAQGDARIQSQVEGQRADTVQEQVKIDETKLEAARKELSRIAGQFSTASEEDQQQAQMEFDFLEEQMKIKPVAGNLDEMYKRREQYEQVYNWIADEGLTKNQAKVARTAARTFATAPAGAQEKIIEFRNEAIKEGKGRGRALTDAINRWKSMGGESNSSATATFNPEENPQPAPSAQQAKRVDTSTEQKIIRPKMEDTERTSPRMDRRSPTLPQTKNSGQKEKEIRAIHAQLVKDKIPPNTSATNRAVMSKRLLQEAQRIWEENQKSDEKAGSTGDFFAGMGAGLPTGGAIGGASP